MPQCQDHEIEQLAALHERPVVRAEPSGGTSVPTKQAVYIAGPMRGIPYYNFPAFDAAADALRCAGYTVVSPADLDREAGFDAMDCPPDTDWGAIPDGFNFHACVRRDIDGVVRSDALYLLPGWERSEGARAEKVIAEWLGRDVLFAPCARQAPEPTILDEAKGHVYGDRGADYGHPADDHGKVAGAISALLADKLRVPLTALDVELVMIVVKLSRLAHKYKRDSVVDIAGYAATMEMSEERTPDPCARCEPCDPPDSEVVTTFHNGWAGDTRLAYDPRR